MTTQKLLSKQEFFALPDDKYIAAIVRGWQPPAHLPDIRDHEDMLQNNHSRSSYDERAKMRTYFLKMVKPRNKILELVDHFLLLENEVLEMNKRMVDLLAYARSGVVDESTGNALRYSFWEASAEVPEAESRVEHQNEGGSGGFDSDTIAEETGLPLDFHPGFERTETNIIVKALNEEAPSLLSEFSNHYQQLRTAFVDGPPYVLAYHGQRYLIDTTPPPGLIRSKSLDILSRERNMSGSCSIQDRRDLGFNSRSERGSFYITKT